jgi:hypothetical protein
MLRQVDCERLLVLTGSRLSNGNGEMPDAATDINPEESSVSMAGRKVSILLPYTTGFAGIVVASLLYYAKHMGVAFELLGNSLLIRARNELAMRFLRSEREWSLWVDSDVLMPFGNPGVFLNYSKARKLPVKFAAYNTVTRLVNHNQPLVGGIYSARQKFGNLVCQPELEPRNANDNRLAQTIREGRDAGGLIKVDWLAAGLMLVHRQVYETIMQNEPKKQEPYGFFDPEDGSGEDIAFCRRARRNGFQPLLDTEVRAGHIGTAVWLPEDSVPPIRMGGSRER